MGIISDWEQESDLYDDDYPDEEDWEQEDREYEEWVCLYPGECLAGYSLRHHSSECYTAAQARAFEIEMEREGA